MIVGTDHISFTVSDIERSRDFYRQLLQQEPLDVGHDEADVAAQVIGYDRVSINYAYFALPGTSSVLELFEYEYPEGTDQASGNCDVGNGHLGLVSDDLSREFERLSVLGGEFVRDQPVQIDEGPWAGSKAIYMRDPDGITIELLEAPPPAAARFGPH